MTPDDHLRALYTARLEADREALARITGHRPAHDPEAGHPEDRGQTR